MKKIYFWLLPILSFVITGVACGQSITNWGPNVAGLRIALLLSNNVVEVGTSATIECAATNTTDKMVIFAMDPHLDTQLSLAGNGKKFDLSIFPGNFRPGGGPGFGVQAHEMELYAIPITIKSNTPPGQYTLSGRIALRVHDIRNPNSKAEFPEVESSPVIVKIK